jgi:hypothetical protein
MVSMDVPESGIPTWRHYLRFFWPLSLMGVVMPAGRLAQNRALLDFDSGESELAVFVLALALLGPFWSVRGLMPQMVTVVGMNRAARHLCFRFVTGVCVVLSVPVLVLALTPLGIRVAQALYDVDADSATVMMVYLRFLTPLLILGGWRQVAVGLLVRQERTGWVTGLHALEPLLLVVMLVLGMKMHWTAVVVVGLSALVPAVIVLAVAIVVVLRGTFDEHRVAESPMTYRGLQVYFWPLAMTTFMFSLSRPIIFALVMRINGDGRSEQVDTTAIVAALGLAFSCGMIFQVTVNQFRHLMVRFGDADRQGVRRFMAAVTLVVVGLMLVALLSPLARLFFVHLQGAQGHTLLMALDALWLLCLVPIVLAWRNYHHGLALVEHRTLPMAVGGVARNGSILVLGIALLATGLLNHRTAAALLVTGFIFESVVVVVMRRRRVAA